MDAIARALADPAGRDVYFIFCFLLLLAPMLALALWYHSRIKRVAGGRAAMREQSRIGVRPVRIRQTIRFARDIAAGRYGTDVRQLQVTVYWMVGVWLLVNAIAFGILFWADEANRP